MKNIFIAAATLFAISTTAFAHSGGLNAEGCHNQRGGSYHCHNGSVERVSVKKQKKTDLISGKVSVVDGDTIKFGKRTIRLHGIDAPEKKQPCYRDGRAWDCGMASKNSLTNMVRGSEVSCRITETDKYGRGVGVCTVNGSDINGLMVMGGWAMAYVKYSSDYVGHEYIARSEKVGIWTSTFDAPWVWRKR